MSAHIIDIVNVAVIGLHHRRGLLRGWDVGNDPVHPMRMIPLLRAQFVHDYFTYQVVRRNAQVPLILRWQALCGHVRYQACGKEYQLQDWRSHASPYRFEVG